MDTENTDGHIETVNHPTHYNQYKGFEVIDVCEQLRAPDGGGNFNRGNAFKYLARAGWKNPDKHVEDLEKVIFYMQREIERLISKKGFIIREEPAEPILAEVKDGQTFCSQRDDCDCPLSTCLTFIQCKEV